MPNKIDTSESEAKNPSYQKLEKYFHRIHQLDHAMAILSWDESVNMPGGGSESRAVSNAELKVIKHELLTSSALLEALQNSEINKNNLSDWQKANLREAKIIINQARALDHDLVEAQAMASSRCEFAWRSLRKQNDWNSFAPLLKKVIHLSQAEAQARAQISGMGPYDSLLELYGPGFKSKEIADIFTNLKTELPILTQKIIEKQKNEPILPLPGPFAKQHQYDLAKILMSKLGFDFEHGRLDESIHPFCGGVPRDVRITTRYQESNFSESLLGVIHETGHAQYEQNLPQEWLSQPVGMARGMHWHESQSLFFEMQLARSIEFISTLVPIIKQYLLPPSNALHSASNVNNWDKENIYRYFTRVKPGLIRVSADEVTYPAHIILRFEIERALIEENLNPDDIPILWDHKMQQYLGLSTKGDFNNGCMQDIHWPMGSFGYFPSYTLGALIAAQLFNSISKIYPNIKEDIVKGDLTNLRSWLLENVWKWGSFFTAPELLQKSTGESLNPNYFLQHLKNRYR